MKFLDSNVLAYAFYRNEHMQGCQLAINEGGVTNTLTLIEAFFIIEKETGSRETAHRAVRGLLKSSVEIVDTDINLLFEALRLVSKLRLSIFDAVHYACASARGCDAVMSYDKDFDRLDIPREEP